MVSPTNHHSGHPEKRKRALVVQSDPATRKQVCEQLIHRGFEVDASTTVAEGLANYRTQPLVVTTTERDPALPRGFIAWLHEQHPEEMTRPYILAVCDREASLGTPPQNRAWDELLTTPLEAPELKARIAAIGAWVDGFLAAEAERDAMEEAEVEEDEPAVMAVPVAEARDTGKVAIRPKFPDREAQTRTQAHALEAAPKVKLKVSAKSGNGGEKPAQVLAQAPTQTQAQTQIQQAPVMKVPPPPKVPPPKTAPVKPITPKSGNIEPHKPPLRTTTGIVSLSPTEQMQALIDNSPQALAMLDRDLRYLVVNRRWLRDFRLEEDENLIGRSHLEVFPKLEESMQRVFRRALDGISERGDEDLWVRPDGSQEWVNWEVQPWSNGSREVKGITICCEVVGKSRSDEKDEGQGELERVGHSLLRGKVTPVLCLGLDGTIEDASEACQRYLADSASPPAGEKFWDLFANDQRREDLKIEFLAAAKETREKEYFAFPPTYVTEVNLNSGGETAMAWSTSPRHDASGLISGLICVGMPIGDGSALLSDIGKARKSRQKLSGASAFYAAEPAAILEQVSFGIVVLDAQRNTLYANPEHRQLLGYDVEAVDDIEDWIRQAAPNPNASEALLADWRENVWQRQTTRALTLKTRDGVLREIEFRPRPTADGGVMLTLFDVTEKTAQRGGSALQRGQISRLVPGCRRRNRAGRHHRRHF